jgi:hypothetical protein
LSVFFRATRQEAVNLRSQSSKLPERSLCAFAVMSIAMRTSLVIDEVMLLQSNRGHGAQSKGAELRGLMSMQHAMSHTT